MLLQIGLEEQYYAFYDEKLKEYVIEWCGENELEYEKNIRILKKRN